MSTVGSSGSNEAKPLDTRKGRKCAFSLRAKLAIFAALLVIAVGTLLGSLSYIIARQIVIQQIEERLTVATASRQAMLLNYINREKQRAQLLASSPPLIALLRQMHGPNQADPAARTWAQAAINSYVSRVEGSEVIWLTDLEGNVVASTDLDFMKLKFSENPFFLRGLTEGSTVGILRTLPGRDRSIVSASVSQQNGEPLGVLMVLLDAEPMINILSNTQGLGETGEVVIASPSNGGVRYLVSPRTQPDLIEQEDPPPALVAALRGETGYLMPPTEIIGRPVIAAYRPVGYADWAMVARIDINEAFVPLYQLRRFIFAATAIMILTGLVISLLWSVRLTRPLLALAKSASALANERAVQPVILRGRDEITLLADSFNAMAKAVETKRARLETDIAYGKEHENFLEDQRGILEQRVQERTAALRESEQQLRKERNLLHAVLQSIGDAVLVANMEDEIVLHNEAAVAMFSEKALRIPVEQRVEFLQMYQGENKAPLENKDLPLIRALQGESVTDMEIFLHNPREDRNMYLSCSSRPLKSEEGKLLGGVLVARDITQRKRMDAALRESDERLRFTLHAARVGTWHWDLKTGRVRWSENLEEIHGLKPGTFGGSFYGFVNHVYSADRDMVLHDINVAVETRNSYETAYRVKADDGRLLWVEGKGRVILDPDNQVVGMTGICMEVTRRKAMEEALRISEERYALAMRGTSDGLWDWDACSNRLFYSDRMRQMLGDLPEKPGELFRYFRKHIPEEDVRTLLNTRRNHITKQVPFDVEFRMPNASGQLNWYRARGEAVRDAHGRAVRMAGSISDVTERREAIDALRVSEAKFRAMAESSPMGIFFCNTQGELLYINRRFLEIAGVSRPSEVMGKGWAKFIHPEDREVTIQKLQQALAEQSRYHHVHRMIRNDGSIVWTNVNAAPVHSGENIIGMVGLVEDVTARREVEQALRDSEERFRSLAESNMIGVAFWGLDGSIDPANSAFINLLGIQPDKFARHRKPMWQNIIPDNLPHLSATEMMNDNNVQHAFETEFIRFDGSRIPVLLGGALVGDPPQYGVAFALDQTQRKAAEAEVQRLNANLERQVEDRTRDLVRANKELEAFNYSVSHDLRGPLRSIDGYSLLLYEQYHDKLDERARHDLSRIRAAVERMTQLIDALLQLSRAARAQVHRQRVNLTEMGNELISQFQQHDPEREVEFVAPEEIPAEGDPHLLHEVLENLLGNAWKFTANSENPRIELGIAVMDDRPTYFVRDNGVGFDMAFQDKLFRPFQRLHSTSDFPGAGVGLASASRIIERHGGRIWAESKPGQGATFYFTLGPA